VAIIIVCVAFPYFSSRLIAVIGASYRATGFNYELIRPKARIIILTTIFQWSSTFITLSTAIDLIYLKLQGLLLPIFR